MRGVLVGVWLVCATGVALAQNVDQQTKSDSSHSTGRTGYPETKGQMQPQGPTGPIDTQTTGGAPASSPQGETPPGMQSAPEGSSKTTVEPGGK